MQRTSIDKTINKIGEEVLICGWVNSRRDHGKIIFIDLRDVSGLVQVVFMPTNKELYQKAEQLRSEWVVEIKGVVSERPEKMINSNLATGKIEITAQNLEILSKSKTSPFEIEKAETINEETRLKYRYLDLRQEKMKNNFILRHKVNKFLRDFLDVQGFFEIETPILTKSTPEGARDYVVPSRLQPGKFYALPQSPQQYKQLLMVAGFEKYFQIARCFRDEDTRGDRQPEFTQLDMEMSFVGQEDILNLVEKLLIDLVKNIVPKKEITQIPLPRFSYKEVMEKYQSDKPDLRKDKNNPNELAFAFVVDFPMFEWREEPPFAKASGGKEKRLAGRSLGEGRWDAVHHPFTRPQSEDIKKMKEKPADILAYQYDVVCNGYEIGGGSLRSYKPEILESVFEIMGHKKADIQNKFGHLLEAFKYGVPPHGGIAIGLDRLLMILSDEETIRQVIAFPKTGDGRDLMMDAPSEIEQKQLKELHIRTLK